MSDQLIWERDGRNWPNRASSRFVDVANLRWHVQVMGQGPAILLVHGTGASAHSFRALASLLMPDFTVIIPDLPGHGFSAAPKNMAGYSLPGVAAGLTALLGELALEPSVVAGHSAGAAVAIRMALDRSITPRAVISINGALMPFPGMTNEFFGPLARFVASASLTAKTFSLFAGAGLSVERMLQSTGSRIDPDGKRLYKYLAGNAGHVRGALSLMANWDLRPLICDLPRLEPRLILVTGNRDGMVPPGQSYKIRSLIPKAELVSLRGLGHLAHEEKPEEIESIVRRC